MARRDKLAQIIRAEWPLKLDAEVSKRFNVEIETDWNDGEKTFYSRRVDGGTMSPEMYAFIHGYMVAMNHVYVWNGRV